jgi:hypothetical protein
MHPVKKRQQKSRKVCTVRLFRQPPNLTFGELLATARLVQAYLLTFHFTGIASHETGFAEF